ncbi:MAG: DUF1501 domain-containing protein [Planctomycetes bacterium]|nr:DUF1501 domain-containing protein [Planctomycetota bacterium]
MLNLGSSFRLPKNITRRDVMRASLLSAGLMALGPIGRRASEASGAPLTGHKRLVVINMSGGCDTLHMVIPVGLAQYSVQRGAITVPSSSALALNGNSLYKLHPSMPRVQGLWNSGDAAAVQRVGYPTANLSHFESQDIFSYGVRNGFGPLGINPSGWIARYADLNTSTPLGAVSVGFGRPLDFVGGTTNPLLVSSLAGFKLTGTGSTNARLYRIEKARSILQASSTTGLASEAKSALSSAHDLTSQVATALSGHTTYLSTAGVTWPNTTIANRMKDIAALIQGGFETRIFYTGFGGFDTHGGQGAASGGALPPLFSQLDGAIGAFSDEMKALGVWDDVMIVVITEFGRRTGVNGSAGTDHGHAFSSLLLGGAISGGSSYGPDLTDADLTNSSGYLSYGVDFRSIYKEVLKDHLGADPIPVFPEPLAIENVLNFV